MVDVDREVDGLFEGPDGAAEVPDEIGALPEALADAGVRTREEIAGVDSAGGFTPNVISWPVGTSAEDFDLPLTGQRGRDADYAQAVHEGVMAEFLADVPDTIALYDAFGACLEEWEGRLGMDSVWVESDEETVST